MPATSRNSKVLPREFSMAKFDELIKIQKEEIQSALDYLVYSLNKVKKLSNEPSQLDPETLETWESFVSRFARVSDIFLAKYLRSRILNADPGFRGELRDYVDQAEKSGHISSADKWMEVRELRNKIAHEYTKSDLSQLFKDVLAYTPFIIDEIKKEFS